MQGLLQRRASAGSVLIGNEFHRFRQYRLSIIGTLFYWSVQLLPYSEYPEPRNNEENEYNREDC